MIKLQLINADIIYDTAIVTSLLFRKSFNCRYNPRMDYAFCLLTLKSSEKWRSPYIIWCYRQLQSPNSTLLYTRDVNRFWSSRQIDADHAVKRSKLGALYRSSGINGAKSCILGLSWHLISLLKLHFFVLFFSYIFSTFF